MFGPFQQAWLDRCDYIVEETGEEMRKENFVKEYMQVRQAAFKSSTIVTAWRKSGAWPINPSIFKSEDYAPSVPFSTEAAGVPPTFPSQDPIPMFDGDNSDSTSDCDSDSDSDSDTDSDANLAGIHPMKTGTATSTTHLPRLPPSPATPATDNCNTLPSSISTREFYHEPKVWGYIERLEHELQYARGHLTMAEVELRNLKRSLNSRGEQKSKRRKLNVEHQLLTSDVGLRLAEENEAEHLAKKQKKKEAAERKKAKEMEQAQRRANRDPNEPFTGSLKSKCLSELQDLCSALGIPETGTKKVLLTRVEAHFAAHPNLRQSPIYCNIFRRAPRRAPSNPVPSSLSIPLQTNLINNIIPPSDTQDFMNQHPYSHHHTNSITPLYSFHHAGQFGTPPQAQHNNALVVNPLSAFLA